MKFIFVPAMVPDVTKYKMTSGSTALYILKNIAATTRAAAGGNNNLRLSKGACKKKKKNNISVELKKCMNLSVWTIDFSYFVMNSMKNEMECYEDFGSRWWLHMEEVSM